MISINIISSLKKQKQKQKTTFFGATAEITAVQGCTLS